jgi:hypothetical protein
MRKTSVWHWHHTSATRKHVYMFRIRFFFGALLGSCMPCRLSTCSLIQLRTSMWHDSNWLISLKRFVNIPLESVLSLLSALQYLSVKMATQALSRPLIYGHTLSGTDLLFRESTVHPQSLKPFLTLCITTGLCIFKTVIPPSSRIRCSWSSYQQYVITNALHLISRGVFTHSFSASNRRALHHGPLKPAHRCCTGNISPSSVLFSLCVFVASIFPKGKTSGTSKICEEREE